jgi:hypothetical protein
MDVPAEAECWEGWKCHEDGSPISVPVSYSDAKEVRRWCAENCRGDYLISLNHCVVFQRREDAALARTSHERRCIGALNRRKFFCDKDL